MRNWNTFIRAFSLIVKYFNFVTCSAWMQMGLSMVGPDDGARLRVDWVNGGGALFINSIWGARVTNVFSKLFEFTDLRISRDEIQFGKVFPGKELNVLLPEFSPSCLEAHPTARYFGFSFFNSETNSASFTQCPLSPFTYIRSCRTRNLAHYWLSLITTLSYNQIAKFWSLIAH